MLLKSYKPLLPTWRYKNSIINVTNRKLPNYSRFLKPSSSGLNYTGSRIINTKTHKSKIKVPVYMLRIQKKSSYYLESFGFNSGSRKFYNVWKDQTGRPTILPAIEYSQPGIKNYPKNKTIFFSDNLYYHFGFPILLSKVTFFHKVSNLFMGLKKISKIVYSTASGTHCLKLRAEKSEKLIKIKLPSSVIKFFSTDYMCFLGKNFQAHNNYRVVGKAGININNGIRQTVRGVAMNPVDHPNGGRTKSCSPELSPWGWIAKKNK